MDLLKKVAWGVCLVCALLIPAEEQDSSEEHTDTPVQTVDNEPTNPPSLTAQTTEKPQSNQLQPLKLKRTIPAHANIALPQDI